MFLHHSLSVLWENHVSLADNIFKHIVLLIFKMTFRRFCVLENTHTKKEKHPDKNRLFDVGFGDQELCNRVQKVKKLKSWHSFCRSRLVVTATDRGTPRLAGSATLTVIIIDLNDNSPMIPLPQKIRVPEGKSASQWKLAQWSYHKASHHTPWQLAQQGSVRKVWPFDETSYGQVPPPFISCLLVQGFPEPDISS